MGAFDTKLNTNLSTFRPKESKETIIDSYLIVKATVLGAEGSSYILPAFHCDSISCLRTV